MCKICDKVFPKNSLFNIHVNKDYLKTSRMCPDCGKTSVEHLKICQEVKEILSVVVIYFSKDIFH